MNAALVCWVILASTPWSAFAGTCTGLKLELDQVSKDLIQGDVSRADHELAVIEGTHPDCSEAVLDRARVEAAKGEAEKAEESFAHYNDLEPKNGRGFAYHARFLIDQGQYERADAMSLLAIQVDPEASVALEVRGNIMDMKGDSHGAILLLEKACRNDPEDSEARFELGEIYDRTKRSDEAVKMFEEEVAINPQDARGWDYLALNLEPLGELDRAAQAYRNGLKVNRPGSTFDAFFEYNYGRFLMKRNDLKGSKDALDQAVGLTPDVRAPWYERARLNLRLKNLAAARTDAEKAASIEDTQGVIIDLQVYSLLERIYSLLGETELANKYAGLSREARVPVQSAMDRSR